jgi:hypothetical protein
VIFTSAESLFNHLTEVYHAQGKPSVDIATYGIYLGFAKGKDWHELYPVAARKFIDIVDKDSLRMLIGKYPHIPCTVNCQHCLDNYNSKQKEVDKTVVELGITAKQVDRFHMKMYRIGKVYVSGGINLGPSGWVDMSFVIHDKAQKKAMQDLFDKMWDGGDYGP